MNFQLSAQALQRLQAGFERAPALTRQRMLGAMTGVTMFLEGEVKDEWPVGVFNSREQIHSDAFSTPAGVLGVLGSSSPYAPVIEFGRQPGKGVNQQGQLGIALWAEKKLGVPAAEALGVAFLIARKIKRHGLPAKRPFQKVLDRNAGQVIRYFEDAIAQLWIDLGKGLT